jgi:hypothetical protein
MASLANFTLLEKTEILEKSKIGEHVKDSVMKSPVASKIYKRCEANAEDFAILKQVDRDKHRSSTDLASNNEDMDL